MSEVWKRVPGWEEFYAASPAGAVKRIAPVPARRCGSLLKPGACGGHPDNRYLGVTLSGGGRRANLYVHYIVALTFLPPPPDDGRVYQVDHISEDKTDNRAENLEWVTGLENMRKAHASGTYDRVHGENSNRAKLTLAQARWIKANKSRLSLNEMAARLGCSRDCVRNVVVGRTWKREVGRASENTGPPTAG